MANIKKRKPYKGKGSNHNRKRNFDKDTIKETRDQEVDPTNDPSWYAQYPELMRDSASIPYSIPTGTRTQWNVVVEAGYPLDTGSNALYRVANQSVPGIMTIGIAPTPGVSINPASPINVATKQLYSKVRAENSGAKVYDPADLMLYCLAMDQVYSLLTWYTRVYGTMMLYSQVNRYLPKALLEAAWIDFDDMILHINDFKAFLDVAIAQAAVFAVPSDMKLFNRHAFMYQNIYKDAESIKSQIYQFVPRLFYWYDEYSGSGRLRPIDIVATYPNKMKFADFVSLFWDLIGPIVASEDFNIMSGDILKAFKPEGIIKLQLVPTNYTVYPVTDYEVLTQIKNGTMTWITASTFSSIVSDPDNWTIHQDANNEFIEYNPYLLRVPTNQVLSCYSKDRYLSTYKTDPEPSDNMVYTRLMYIVKDDSDSNYNYLYFDTVGTEFITGIEVSQYATNGSGVWTLFRQPVHTISEVKLTSLSMVDVHIIGLVKHFDYAPCIYHFFQMTNATVFTPIFDLDNWTIVHAYELEKMHRTALMSMCRVPMIGSALSAGDAKK